MSKAAQQSEKAEERILDEIAVPGEHMRVNVLNAALCMRLLNITPEQTAHTLAKWSGLEHRLEFFHEWKSSTNHVKVRFYNDSCATVPEAAVAACNSFRQQIVYIGGGTDKDLDFTPLANTLNGKENEELPPLQIYLLSGTGTDKLLPLLQKKSVIFNGPFESLETLIEVLKSHLERADGDTVFKCRKGCRPVPVVFSPGATSFGMFANEFDRGNKFKELVKYNFY